MVQGKALDYIKEEIIVYPIYIYNIYIYLLFGFYLLGTNKCENDANQSFCYYFINLCPHPLNSNEKIIINTRLLNLLIYTYLYTLDSVDQRPSTERIEKHSQYVL